MTAVRLMNAARGVLLAAAALTAAVTTLLQLLNK